MEFPRLARNRSAVVAFVRRIVARWPFALGVLAFFPLLIALALLECTTLSLTRDILLPFGKFEWPGPVAQRAYSAYAATVLAVALGIYWRREQIARSRSLLVGAIVLGWLCFPVYLDWTISTADNFSWVGDVLVVAPRIFAIENAFVPDLVCPGYSVCRRLENIDLASTLTSRNNFGLFTFHAGTLLYGLVIAHIPAVRSPRFSGPLLPRRFAGGLVFGFILASILLNLIGVLIMYRHEIPFFIADA